MKYLSLIVLAVIIVLILNELSGGVHCIAVKGVFALCLTIV